MINEQSLKPNINKGSNCVVIVAHPDDETLWAGGTILMHPETDWTIVSLCRESDPDRAPKFFRAIKEFNAKGFMGDMNDEPEQTPLYNRKVQKAIMELMPSDTYDLIFTHSTFGEYTRHLRHEETAKAVLALWNSDKLIAEQLWAFAYEDGNRKYLPRPVKSADIQVELPKEIWQKKYEIITDIYGFDKESFEAKTTPRREAFWCFRQAC
jgi:LmbE family N-acetylglucosaminyl deacetylase